MMLKWDTDNGLKSKSLRVTVRTTAGISGYDATPADLIACLKANPEAYAEVMRGLDENYDRSIGVVVRRAESAERSRDELREALTRIQTVVAPKLTKQLPAAGVANEVIRLHSDFMLMQRERDEARAALAEAHRGVCRGDGHDTPAMTAGCVVSAFNSARLDHTTDLDEMTGRVNEAITERDAALARATAAEAVVEAARRSENYLSTEALNALRAYDAAQAKDSGGASGASPAMVADAEPTPEPAGGSSVASALEERIVERVCAALERVAETVPPAHWSAGMMWLADELRRRPQ